LIAFKWRQKALRLLVKGLLSIKRKGIKETVKKVSAYIFKPKKKSKKLSLFEINKLYYESEYQENKDFSKYKPKVKTIAFYLPQFHSIPENDKWWGEGFTEWTNTRKVTPRFKGHYQPREPHDDFGYYNLTDINILKKQALLAKQHGIYGFCFYFYWFSGKRLLEKPLDLFLEHPEIDINFCLCWVNENWTRKWDGFDKEILMKQDYAKEDTYNFIVDIKKYVIDKRYIKIDGEPVILVYNPSQIPNINNVINIWREQAINYGIGKIKIWICRTFGHTAKSLNIINNIDGEVEFPPHGTLIYKEKIINIRENSGKIFNYKEIVKKNTGLINGKNREENDLNLPVYNTSMLGWDNAARRTSGWTTYADYSLKFFYIWVKAIVDEAKRKTYDGDPFVFINAWNEWAEGTYLEPDKKYGYANINTLSRAICELSFNDELPVSKKNSIIYVSHDAFPSGAQILSINIIKQIKEIFGYNVYTIIKTQKTGNMLVNDFKAISDNTIIFDEVEISDLKKWINSTNANTAICNTVVSGDVLHFLTEYGITCISLVHEMEMVIRQYSCENNLEFIINDAHKIIYPSKYVKKSNSKIIPIPENKVIIHPQGLYKVNSNFKNQEVIRLSIRKKHNIPKNSKIVLGVGYGYYRKGIDLFVQCMLNVCEKDNNVFFIWVGEIEEKMKITIKKILKESELKSKFITTGWEKDITKYFTAADVFLLTSREDPFPSVVMEAMSAYLPVIAFENGGGYEEIIDHNTGGLVPMENIKSMSETTIKLLNDDNLRLEIGKHSHNLIEEKFNFTEYIYFLLELLGNNYKKVSVIIPNYNYAKYLRKRIESILSQTYPVFEIIILDDYSTDKSLEIISEYENKFPLRIKSIRNEKNSGNVFEQWSKGIKNAKGDYIWIAEADDLSETIFLEEIMKKMSLDENIVMGYTQSKIINEKGKVTEENYLPYTDKIDTIWRTDYIADGKEEIEKRLSIKNTVLNVSAAVFKNKNLLEKLENAKKYNAAGDWRFYVDLLKDKGMILFIADSLNLHRRHTNSVTKALNAQKHFDEICDMQDYIFSLTKNTAYFEMAKKYREEVKEYLNIN